MADVIAKWDGINLENMTPSELLTGAYEVMYAVAKYYIVMQSSILPSATVSEIIFTHLYNAINHNKGPKAEKLLFGLDTVPLRAEKPLFDLAMWVCSCAAGASMGKPAYLAIVRLADILNPPPKYPILRMSSPPPEAYAQSSQVILAGVCLL